MLGIAPPASCLTYFKPCHGEERRRMIGLQVRRFMAQQVVSVTQHIPLLHGAAMRLQSGGQWLISPEEAEYSRKISEEDGAVESRCVFSVRKPKSTLTGIGAAAWNVGVGCIFAPLVGLSVLSSAMREQGPGKGLVVGSATGTAWACSFVAIGGVAAAQQFLFGTGNDVLRVYNYLVGLQQWDDVCRRYAAPRLSLPHPIVQQAQPTEVLREAAQRRALRNKSKSSKLDNNDDKEKTTTKSGGDDLYQALGIQKTASDKEIKEAYNRLALALHPDRNPKKDAHEQFDRVTKAYKILNNPAKRKKYDLGGHDGLEDTGAKKREAIRSILGGDALCKLVGEVRTSPIFMRVVDGLDYLPHDLAIVARRTLDASCAELLSYLEGYKSEDEKDVTDWLTGVKRRVVKYSNTALAKEVMYLVGHEYHRSVAYVKDNPVTRLSKLLVEVGPHRISRRAAAYAELAKVNVQVTKDMTAFMNLSWKFIAMDLERNAREVSVAVLLDHDATEEERKRRLNALQRLAALFVANGRGFSGADKGTVEKLVESMRDYQRSKAASKQD